MGDGATAGWRQGERPLAWTAERAAAAPVYCSDPRPRYVKTLTAGNSARLRQLDITAHDTKSLDGYLNDAAVRQPAARNGRALGHGIRGLFTPFYGRGGYFFCHPTSSSAVRPLGRG